MAPEIPVLHRIRACRDTVGARTVPFPLVLPFLPSSQKMSYSYVTGIARKGCPYITCRNAGV